jgi:hypothetical protein
LATPTFALLHATMTIFTLLSRPGIWLTDYLLGMQQYPQARLRFGFNRQYSDLDFTNRLAIEVAHGGTTSTIIIDTDDPAYNTQLSMAARCQWLFVSNRLLNQPYPVNVVSLAPHFPVRLSSFWLKAFARTADWRFLKMLYSGRRLPVLPTQHTCTSFSGSGPFPVFYKRTLWKRESHTNDLGALFIRLARKHPDLEFTGGLFRADGFCPPEYADVFYAEKIPPRRYLQLMLNSYFVLNSPASKGANSWRLGEYLCYGKCILTVPFQSEVPAALQAGIHYIPITPDTMPAEMDRLVVNPALVTETGRAAQQFWMQYCAPQEQVNFILRTLQQGA